MTSQFKNSINDYLEGLPEAVLTRLYQSPATCLAVFRLLPALARTLIMGMIFNPDPITVADVDALVKPSSQRIKLETQKKLRLLHILNETQAHIIINPTFKKNLRAALVGGDQNISFGVPCDTEDKHKVDVAFLDAHAVSQWEMILHFMVGTSIGRTPSDGVLNLLKHSGLMEPERGGLRITNAGFQFLLQDVNAQIWTLLLQYLNMSEYLQMDPVDVLNFIFMLGSLELGQDYSLSALSETQKHMLEDLRDYGIVYQRKASSRRFYPTRLATTLTSETAALRTASQSMEAATQDTISSSVAADSGFIILETNFRLYAYTESPLQIAVLNLFSNLKTRFANMVTGQINRDSVRFALSNGITAEQIITYLSVHAHPRMKGADHVLPPTVVDQIKLWQLEMDRIRATDGYLFSEFKNFDEYKDVSTYAKELGVLLYENPGKRKFVSTLAGSQQIVEFVKRRNQKHRNSGN